jgi:cytochrome c biogenesis factor
MYFTRFSYDSTVLAIAAFAAKKVSTFVVRGMVLQSGPKVLEQNKRCLKDKP